MSLSTRTKVFLRATLAGNVPLMRRMLERAPDLIERHHPDSGRRPIHMAIRGAHLEALDLLLEHGADPTAPVYPVREATDPLTMAEDRGLVEIAQRIRAELSARTGMAEPVAELCEVVRSGEYRAAAATIAEDPSLLTGADKHGNTLLHAAVEKRSLPLVRTIIEHMPEPDLDARNQQGHRPLQLAMSGGKIGPIDAAVAGVLLQAGAEYPLWCAAALGDMDSVQRFVEVDRVSPDDNESLAYSPRAVWAPLVKAAAAGHAEIVAYLLDQGADIDAVVTTHDQDDHLATPTGYIEEGLPLLHAIDNGHFDIAHLLLDRGARCDTRCVYAGSGVADVAVECPDIRVRNRVLMNGGRPLLYTLVATRQYPALIELLKPSRGWAKHDTLPSGSVENLALILDWAVYFGDRDLVGLCLSYKPELTEPQWASQLLQLTRGQAGTVENGVAVLRTLLEYGVNPNAEYREGATMMHMVQGCNDLRRSPAQYQIAMIDCLLEYGADINRIDNELLSTPLGWRCRYGDAEVVEHLISRGADPELAGADWARPLEWAIKRGHREIENLVWSAISGS